LPRLPELRLDQRLQLSVDGEGMSEGLEGPTSFRR
jgi:hypothetical protein